MQSAILQSSLHSASKLHCSRPTMQLQCSPTSYIVGYIVATSYIEAYIVAYNVASNPTMEATMQPTMQFWYTHHDPKNPFFHKKKSKNVVQSGPNLESPRDASLFISNTKCIVSTLFQLPNYLKKSITSHVEKQLFKIYPNVTKI